MIKPLKFLFTTWEGGGNVSPALEAARKLVLRGHQVRFMSEECNRAGAEAVGAEFVSWRRAPSRKDRSRHSQTYQDWAAATPQEGLLMVIKEVWCGPALAYAQDLIEELGRCEADLVITCEALFGVMAACESLGQRFVTLCPNISLAPLPGIPPIGPGLPPARSDEDRAMHAQLSIMLNELFNSGLPQLNAARATLGLKPLSAVLEQFKSAELELLATSRAFDFTSENLPERVRYVGPQMTDPHWAQDWVSPWSDSDSRDLVTVGFSTTFQNHAAVLQRVIDALEPLPTRVLVTRGGSIEDSELRAGENCVIVESAPHSVVMRQSSLVITHGGHGTIMRGLLSRSPMLVIPHGRDQNDNAVRVTERGAGLSLMPDASTEAIRASCLRLLNEAQFRSAARELGDRVAEDMENSSLVAEIEGLFSGCSESSSKKLAQPV
ncbi:MAG: glycosyltransferase [Candidatus Obscuribacterales bacterium]|nr:glycosyltransferase [Candidatus Obscuribacterales bacterium]